MKPRKDAEFGQYFKKVGVFFYFTAIRSAAIYFCTWADRIN